MGIETEQMQVTGLHLQQHLTEAFWELCFPAHAHTCHLVTFVMSFMYFFLFLCIYTYIRRYSPAVSDQFALSPFRHQLSSYPDRQPAAPALVHTGICTKPGHRWRDVPSTQHPPVDCAAHARSGGGPGLQVRQEHQQTGGCIFWLVLLFEEHQQVRTSSDFCLPCLDSLQNINRQMSTSSGLCCCLKNINR